MMYEPIYFIPIHFSSSRREIPVNLNRWIRILGLRLNNLLKNTYEMDAYLVSKLEDLQAKTRTIGDIRSRGLLIGIELVASRTTKESYK